MLLLVCLSRKSGVSSFTITKNHGNLIGVRSTTSSAHSSPSISSLQMNVLSHTISTIQTFSSSSLETVTASALSTPPLIYFLCLLSAGFGVPVSEDALCLFAGTAWPTFTKEKRLSLFVALYAGVVLSDAITFWAGRSLRLGVFSKLREKFDDLLSSDDEEEEEVIILKPNGKMRKRDRIRRKMKKAGDYVGFVIRFSVGTRGPLMLLCGFRGKVSFLKFILGSAAGACITLPLQLWLGYTLGHNHPAAAMGILGGISTTVLIMTLSVAIASWSTLLLSKLRQNSNQQEQQEESIVIESEEVDL